MSKNTPIPWTGHTINCITGCTKHSEGCLNCYAARMTARLKGMGQEKYSLGFGTVATHEGLLDEIGTYKKPSRVFINSMSDTFHKDVPVEFIQTMFQKFSQYPQHTFQVLTKRSERLKELSSQLTWHPNIWMGVTVEKADYVHRLDDLRSTGAHVKFVSFEPLLGPIPVECIHDLDWVIVGGEKHLKPRPMKLEWARSIRDVCIQRNIAFFFKQQSCTSKKDSNPKLDGKRWQQFPTNN